MVSSLSLVRFDDEIIKNGQPLVAFLLTFLSTQENGPDSEPKTYVETVLSYPNFL